MPLPVVLSLDVGNTLIEPWPSVGHVYAEVAARHGAGALDPDRISLLFLAAWEMERGRFEYTREHWRALVTRTMAPLHAVGDNPDFFAALYDHFAGPSPWRLYDDVLPTLSTLRDRGVRMIAVSNWDDRLRPLLECLGLTRFFEAVLVSGEERVHKPNPEIFRRAATQAGVAPEAIVHVGDSMSEDVAGAVAAGCRAVHLARESDGFRASRPLPSLPGVDRIRSLADLLGLL